jgi:hypothetical protein
VFLRRSRSATVQVCGTAETCAAARYHSSGVHGSIDDLSMGFFFDQRYRVMLQVAP